MKPAEFVATVEQRLRAEADATRAVAMRAYLLDQFAFLGLPAPARRAAVKDLVTAAPESADALLATARLLWSLPEREFRYTAIDLLRQHHRHLSANHLNSLQALLLQDPWWETVDGLAAVIGAIVRRESKLAAGAQQTMDAWAGHPVFWVRRAAMLHQLGWRLETDEQRLGGYALQLADEKDFFIRKAIGWALRDYARWNPEFVRSFITQHRDRLSSLTTREACRTLR